jgi:hypothetical protein
LVDKSLVSPDGAGEGEPRFALLETVREYALEQLQRSGEQPAVQRRHARHYLALAEAAEPLRTPDRFTWLRRLDADDDNLRAALAWSREGDAPDGLVLGLRLAGALGWYWLLRGRLREGRAWLEDLLRRAPAAEGGPAGPLGAARGTALHAAGLLAWGQGDFAAAADRAAAAARVFRDAGDPRRAAYAQVLLARTELAQGQVAQARTRLEEGLTQ